MGVAQPPESMHILLGRQRLHGQNGAHYVIAQMYRTKLWQALQSYRLNVAHVVEVQRDSIPMHVLSLLAKSSIKFIPQERAQPVGELASQIQIVPYSLSWGLKLGVTHDMACYKSAHKDVKLASIK